MADNRSAESLESTNDDDENCLDHLSLQASLSRIDFQSKNDIISPEDIAAVAFPRLFNEDLDSTTGRIYPKTSTVRSPTGQQSLQAPTSTGHGAQKCRHKSPSNRPRIVHPPLSIDGISSWEASNAIRKTKSTALPAIINKSWPRSASASTPELKLDAQGIVIQRLPSNIDRGNGRRAYLIRTTCYYNFRLIYIILNCFILVIGFVYLGAAIALCVQKELVLVIVDYRVHVLSIICLFGLALFLLVIPTSGLCLIQSGPKKTAAYAGCSLVMGAVLVALAFLQSAAQLSVEVDAEYRMLSTIHSVSATIDVWDYLHHAFKCCGVRGYLDWCQKLDGISKIYTSAEDFLGSFTCHLPESCCLSQEVGFGVIQDLNYTSCVVAPTLSNTHRNGCLTTILIVISYFGKIYRVANFVTAFILLLTTTTSMVLFTYL